MYFNFLESYERDISLGDFLFSGDNYFYGTISFGVGTDIGLQFPPLQILSTAGGWKPLLTRLPTHRFPDNSWAPKPTFYISTFLQFTQNTIYWDQNTQGKTSLLWEASDSATYSGVAGVSACADEFWPLSGEGLEDEERALGSQELQQEHQIHEIPQKNRNCPK